MAVHPAPTITNLDSSVSWTEGSAPVTLSPGVLLQSPDSSSFIYTKAVIQIDPFTFTPGDELLVLGGVGSSTDGFFTGTNIDYHFDPLTGTLTLSGSDTVIDYDVVLQHVQFHSTSHNPTFFDFSPTRTINWQVTDAAVPSGPDFADPVQYAAGTNPQGVVISNQSADFNSDLIPDLAVVNAGSNDVSILLGNGDGTFQPAVSFAAGATPSSIVVRDFNGDSIDDLAVTNTATNQVSILLGDGIGGFAAPISTLTGGISPTSLTTADYNGDGKADLAIANVGPDPSTIPGTVTVLMGDGTGHFPGVPTVLLADLNPTFVTTASLHTIASVGQNDLVVANTGSDTISVFLNNGAGVFTKIVTDQPVGDAPVGIASGRFNPSDPGNDLAVVNSGSSDVTVLFGNDDGTFTGSVIVSVGTHPNSISTGDFNGDGNLDFVTANGDGTVSLVYGHGDGTFDPALSYAGGAASDNLLGIAVGDLSGPDFRGDGNDDLAVVDATNGAVSILLHNPTTQSAIETINIDVFAVNDAPVNTHPASITVHQDVPHPIAPLSVADPDAEFMLVTLSVDHGTIHVRDDVAGGLDPGDISGNDTNSVTLNCDLALVDATLAALNGVVYTPESGFVGLAHLTMVSNDVLDPVFFPTEGQTGPGGPLTDTDTVDINVAAALQLNNLDNTPTFFENGPFVTLDNNAVIQGAITFDGATLTLQRDGGANPDDFFSSTFLTPDGEVDMGGGNIVGTYFLSEGLLNITFNSAATETAVDQVLQSFKYGDFSDNPPSSVQIDYSFNDTVDTVNGHILVSIIAVNDPPTLDGVAVSDVYQAGSPPIILSPAAFVSDPDSANLTVATIRITNGFGGDTLTADAGATGITVTPGTFTLTLSGAHTLAQYQQVLETVAYSSTDTDPTGGGAHPSRNIVWQVGDTGGEADSNTQTTLLQYAPLLDLDQSGAGTGFTGHFTEGGTHVAVADTDDFIFTSNTDIVGATITLTDAHPGDTLSYDNSVGGISASTTSNSNTIVLTLSGELPASSYQTALQHVFFSNSSENPDPSDRHISVFVTDEVTTSNTAVDVISVTPVNDPPQAQNGTLNAHVNHAASGTAVATDVDNTPAQLSYSLVGANGGALHGTVVMNSDGSFTYTPAADFAGPDSFNFNATDPGPATSNTASISVTVTPNNAPVAQNGSASGNEDNPISGSAAASDPDGDSFTFALVGANGGAQHGTVSMDAAGHFTYTPAPNFNGNDSFTFKANDGSVDSNTATESITVNPVNDPPAAQNGSASGNEDNAINGTLVATDIDSASLTYSRVSNAAHGTVTVNANGTFSYTPNANFNGTDSFTFKANDGSADSNVATISLTVNPVNDPPVAQNGAASGNEDNPIMGNASAGDVDNDPLTFALVGANGGAAHGTVSLNANGSFTYTPAANFNGTDSFNFKATDNHAAASNTATISITVNPVNDPPVAQNGSASGNEDNTINGALVATDIDSASLTYSRVSNAAHGNVTVNANGTFSYTPAANFNGSDSFTFKANDGSLDSNVATVSLAVNPVDDPPVIVSDGGGDTAALTVPENTTAVTTVHATDVDSPSLTYSIIGGSDAGQFQINGSSGALSFITAPDFEAPADSDHNNTYVVQVQASDGSLTDTQTITVSVGNVDEVPRTVHWAASTDVGSHPGASMLSEAPIDHWFPTGIADFNGDGTSDLAWYNPTTRGVDLWKLSNGQWAGSSDLGTHAAGYQPVGFADFNHDSNADILWFNSTTRDVDLWKISNGQFAGSADIGTHPAGYAPALTGDFNGDGTADVLWYNSSTRDVDIWKISNGQWAGSVAVGTHPAGYTPALSGDFNGDGTSDVMWFNSSTGDVDIWKLSNGQWAGSTSVGAHPAGYTPLGAADFNQDGTSDIVWYNPTTNNIDIWLMKDGHWSGSANIGSHPAGWTAVGVGDFDHSGVPDIMWFNPSTGHIENWMLAYS
ncbi:MAG: Ig-like domain-containing protein [Alphaproteobacteria bacterium]